MRSQFISISFQKYYYERFNYDLVSIVCVPVRHPLATFVCFSRVNSAMCLLANCFVKDYNVNRSNGSWRKSILNNLFRVIRSLPARSGWNNERTLFRFCSASFQIRNIASGFCVDGSTDHKNYHKPVIGYQCHSQGGNQVEGRDNHRWTMSLFRFV